MSRPRLVRASTEHVVEHHARHFGGVLHHEVQAGGGPLPGRQGEDVDSVERDRSLDHLVAGLAHDDGRQRALAGPVGAHHGVHLAGVDGEVDPAQDLLATDGGTQALDLECAHDASSWSFTSTSDVDRDRHHHLAIDDGSVEHGNRLGCGKGDGFTREQAEGAAVLGAFELEFVAPHLAFAE